MQDFPFRLRQSSGEMMSLERDRVLVGFASEDAAAEADDLLSELGLVAEDEPDSYEPAAPGKRSMEVLNRTDTRVWALTVDGTAFRAGSFEAPKEGAIEWVAPVYRLDLRGRSELLSVLPHVL